jgi:prepilin-type N-terminal cleavage/methylation domain-containing protein
MTHVESSSAIKKSRAFTLVELLVVIAVIGILSAVVVLNTQSAKTKARDAIIKSDIAQVKIAIESYGDTVGSFVALQCLYSVLCTDLPASATAQADVDSIETIAADICTQQGGCAGVRKGLGIFSDATKYVVIAALSPDYNFATATTNFFCADSTGAIGAYKIGATGSTPSDYTIKYCKSGI